MNDFCGGSDGSGELEESRSEHGHRLETAPSRQLPGVFDGDQPGRLGMSISADGLHDASRVTRRVDPSL